MYVCEREHMVARTLRRVQFARSNETIVGVIANVPKMYQRNEARNRP